MPLFLFLIPIASTLLGGALAIRWRAHMDLLVAAGTGLLLGAICLDLLPEAIALGQPAHWLAPQVLLLTAAACILFFVLDRLATSAASRLSLRQFKLSGGHVGASLLIFHSFRDGMAIGAAYLTSHNAGYIVALAIAAHDLGDGMNTVLLTTGGEHPRRLDYAFLFADAAAPFAGGLLVSVITVWPRLSVLLLAAAAGFFIQLILSDFIPQLRKSNTPRLHLAASTGTGFAILLVVNLLLHTS